MLRKKLLLAILFILLQGCERDPLSQKGQIHLPKTEQVSSTINPATSEGQHLMKVALTDKVRTIGWDDLVPDEYRPEPGLVDKYNRGEIDDNDPRIIALKEKIEELKKLVPVNKKLDGQTIRMPGFVVPVEIENKIVKEFLLVPYHGACVHVPPPPANQTVYVITTQDSAGEYKNFDTVWVTGTIKVVNTSTDLADTGFTIYATQIEPYN